MSPREAEEVCAPSGVSIVEGFFQLVARVSSEPLAELDDAAAALGRRIATDGASKDELLRLVEAAADARSGGRESGKAVLELLARVVGTYGEKLQDDLTEARKRSRSLAVSEARFRSFLEASPDAVLVVDGDGNIEFSNRAYGVHRPDDAIGTSVFAAMDDVGRVPFVDAMRKALEGGQATADAVPIRGSNGEYRPRAVGLRRLGGPGTSKLLLVVRDDSDAGQSRGLLRDTMRELEESKRQLLHAQKMEALGRLAGGVAHDFNNLLTSIVSFTRFVYDDLEDGDPHREDLSEVLNAASSAAKLTNQLLSFSRRRPVDPETVELGAALRQLSKILRRTIGEHVELVMLLPNDRISVLIDPGQLDQVILNLAVNAHDAMPGGGTLTVALGLLEGGRGRGKGRAVITVTDTGPGVPAAVRDQIFEPFFSTKGERGTGLGLATSYGIVKQAGGDLTVSCPAEGGAVFRIELPLAGSGAQVRSLSGSYAAVRTSLRPKGLALIVDDQPSILRTMKRALEGAGLTVQEARTAEEALALARATRPMVLVSDVVLPGLSGIELTLRIRERYPDLPVLLTSGYMGDDSTYQFKTDEMTAFQAKPFSGAQLLQKLDVLFHADPVASRR